MKGLAAAGIVLIVILGLGVILSLPTWAIWNWLITDVFGLRRINILEAFGLLVFCQMLFATLKNDK